MTEQPPSNEPSTENSSSVGNDSSSVGNDSSSVGNDSSSADKGLRDSQLVGYAPWLRLMARLQIETHFQGKFDESDIAQQTMIEAWKARQQFRGTSEGERVAWLRKILARVIGHEVRRYKGTLKRDLWRERSLVQSIAESSRAMGACLAVEQTSPSEMAAQREQQVLLATVLERLPDEYRQVIVRRNIQQQSHEEIAADMNRTSAAVRMLWIRALKRLKHEMHAADDGREADGAQRPS